MTLRLVGSTLVASVGGNGSVVGSPEMAVAALLRNERVRVPAAQVFRVRVRRLLAERALAGQGPDGHGANWQKEAEATTR